MDNKFRGKHRVNHPKFITQAQCSLGVNFTEILIFDILYRFVLGTSPEKPPKLAQSGKRQLMLLKEQTIKFGKPVAIHAFVHPDTQLPQIRQSSQRKNGPLRPRTWIQPQALQRPHILADQIQRIFRQGIHGPQTDGDMELQRSQRLAMPFGQDRHDQRQIDEFIIQVMILLRIGHTLLAFEDLEVRPSPQRPASEGGREGFHVRCHADLF